MDQYSQDCFQANVKWLNEEIPKNPQDYIKELEAELYHLKREIDQAVEDMRQLAGGQCLFCKHDEDEIFNKCGTDNCWEWRGVQEENNE